MRIYLILMFLLMCFNSFANLPKATQSADSSFIFISKVNLIVTKDTIHDFKCLWYIQDKGEKVIQIRNQDSLTQKLYYDKPSHLVFTFNNKDYNAYFRSFLKKGYTYELTITISIVGLDCFNIEYNDNGEIIRTGMSSPHSEDDLPCNVIFLKELHK